MEKDSIINVRINSSLKDNIIDFCKQNNVTVSALISAYLEETVKRGKIPLNILGKIHYQRNNEERLLTIAYIKKCLDDIISKFGKNDIKKAYLFGSYARGEANKKSDVDIRIETGDKLSLIDLSNIRMSLKDKLGKEIDIISQDPDQLDKTFFREIKKEEICLYEKER